MAKPVPGIYEAAIKRYEETTKENLYSLPVAKLSSVDGLVEAINLTNKDFEIFRQKRHGVFAALSTAMRPIEQWGDLAFGAAEMAFPPSSLVFGSVLNLVSAAKNVSADYDAIEQLMKRLKDFTARLEVYDREEISASMSEKLAEIIVTLIDIFALSKEEIKRGRLRKFAKTLLAGHNGRIQDALFRLQRLTESENLLAGAETLTAVKRSERTLECVSVEVSRLSQNFDAFRAATEDSQARAKYQGSEIEAKHVKDVLRPSVSALDWYDRLSRSRVPDTGNWIREQTLFKRWVSKEIPILWITGTPGAGKSYIASNIISFLRDEFPEGVHHPSCVSVGWFFFKDDNPDTRTFTQALRDIAYQVSQNDPVYEKYIAAMCSSGEEIKSLHSIWRTLFVKYFLQKEHVDSSVYIVLDGLDESYAECREQFLELTKDLQQAGKGRIQLVMLGRPHLIEEIEMAADMPRIPTIHITAANNSEDIVSYIENSIQRSAALRRAPKALQNEVVNKLSSGAQGMFIWVDFMMKELTRIMKTPNESRLRTALNQAPRGLNMMIRHVLEDFSAMLQDNPDGAEELNTILAWVTCACRPLKLSEIDTLLKVASPTGEGNWWLERTLRVQFASVFTLVREDRLTTAELQHATPNDLDDETFFDSSLETTDVTFSHASVGDFLRNESEPKAIASEGCPPISMDFQEARVSVLKTCLTVLCSEESSDLWLQAERLLPYIRTFWISALKDVDISRTTKEDRQYVGKAIVQVLFHDSTIHNVAPWFLSEQYCQENVDLFQKWLTDGEVFEVFSKVQRHWILATSSNRAELLLPYAKFIVARWLQGQTQSLRNCVAIVHAYIGLVKQEQKRDVSSANDIIEAAEWGGLEENAMWHTMLATALREYDYHESAMEHYMEALRLNPSMWQALVGKAICCAIEDTKEAYHNAIELETSALEILDNKGMQPDSDMNSDSLNAIKHDASERIAKYYTGLSQIDKTVEAYNRALQYSNRCSQCITKLLVSYSMTERYQEVIKFLKSMEEPIPGLNYTRLSETLLTTPNYSHIESYFQVVAQAASAENEMPFIFKMYQNAITAAQSQQKSLEAMHLELSLAVLYDRNGQSDCAAKIWENIVTKYSNINLIEAQSKLTRVKFFAYISLGRYCLREAIEYGKDSNEAQQYGDMLEHLAKVKRGGEKTVGASALARMLGSWYRFMGRNEEADSCFRVQIKEGLRMLSDDDADNDLEAYINLASVLTAADDDENALPLYWKARSTAGSILKDEIPGEYLCDACFSWSEGPVAICRYCFDTGFCPKCFQVFKADPSSINICSQKHCWAMAEGRPKEAREVVDVGRLWVDGEHMTLEDFKKRLATRWNTCMAPSTMANILIE